MQSVADRFLWRFSATEAQLDLSGRSQCCLIVRWDHQIKLEAWLIAIVVHHQWAYGRIDANLAEFVEISSAKDGIGINRAFIEKDNEQASKSFWCIPSSLRQFLHLSGPIFIHHVLLKNRMLFVANCAICCLYCSYHSSLASEIETNLLHSSRIVFPHLVK